MSWSACIVCCNQNRRVDKAINIFFHGSSESLDT